MAGLGFIGKFFVKRFLKKWKKRSHKRVLADNVEWAEKIGAKQFYIYRTYNYGSLYVDLYWYIKPSKEEKHVDYLYTRCAWESVKDAVREYESEKLPKTIAESDLI